MQKVQKTVLVEHTAQQMYTLVDDIPGYVQFLPWCGGSEVLEDAPHQRVGRLHIHYHGIRQHFTTRNTRDPFRRIDLQLVDGPFRSLVGHWHFTPLGDTACKIQFVLEYEFSSKLLEILVGPVFGVIANTLVEAFIKRAHEVHGT